MNTWLDHYRRIYYPLLNINFDGTHSVIVAVDDNSRWVNNNRRTGKGRAIDEHLETQGHFPMFDEYQIIFQF